MQTSLEKGLMVLEALNKRSATRVRDLQAELVFPKATILRLLGVLIRYGLVTKLPQSAGYTLTSRAAMLSAGYHHIAIVHLAAPLLDALTRDILWPVSLATLDMDAMVVRYSTIPISPLSHKHTTMSRRLDLGQRAHGRAYLAFVSDRERAALMGFLSADARSYFERHLPRYRRQGWAERAPDLDPETNSIAVPVFEGSQRVCATLGFTFFRNSLTTPQQGEVVQRLIDTAATLSDALPISL